VVNPSRCQTAAQQFGEILKSARLAANLTQKDVADRLRINRRYVGQVERGEKNLSLGACERFAEAVGCLVTLALTPFG
jgi:transcriptional regulator with XRE-family HTH domain